MPRRKFVGLAAFILISGILISGCGRADPAVKNDLREIGLAWHKFHEDKSRPPKGTVELKPYLTESETAYAGLKDGTYVMMWNVKLSDMEPAGEHVLGYEKDVPTKGGVVLFGDGVVKSMTADEFNSAKLAKTKN